MISRNLLELNSDTSGNFLFEDPEVLLKSNPGFLKNFKLVILNNFGEVGQNFLDMH